MSEEFFLPEGYTPEQLRDPKTIAALTSQVAQLRENREKLRAGFEVTPEMVARFRREADPHPYPRWAGAQSWTKACEIADTCSLTEWMDEDFSPLGQLSMRLADYLHKARPVMVAAAQVRALPRWERMADAWEYGQSVRLPFPLTYLDLGSDEDIVSVGLLTPDGKQRLSAGVCGVLARQVSDDLSVELIPVCVIHALDDTLGLPTHAVRPVLGSVVIAQHVRAFPPNRVSMDFRGTIGASVYGAGCFDDPPALAPAAVEPGIDKQALLRAVDLGEAGLDFIQRYERAIGHVSAHAAVTALSVLYFLESANVDIVDATVSRQQRRHAERGGARITQTIRVRRRVRRGGTSERYPGTGSGSLSMQHEVAGHYRHVRHGSHVRCPACNGEQGKNVADKVTRALSWQVCDACNGSGQHPEFKGCIQRDTQTGELTCPDGCRREWVPDYWKGPEDAPAVPKLRKVA